VLLADSRQECHNATSWLKVVSILHAQHMDDIGNRKRGTCNDCQAADYPMIIAVVLHLDLVACPIGPCSIHRVWEHCMQKYSQCGVGRMLNAAFSPGLPGEEWQSAPCGKTMEMGKWAHEKFSLVVAKCMASMPPLKAHGDTISCGKKGASLRREQAKQGIGPGGLGLWC
jgi:hypothetical protein